MLSSEVILDMVREIRKDMPRIGAKKLYIKLTPALKMMGIEIGRDAFAELLSDNNLLVRRKRSRHRTTFSNHRFFKYPNLIRNFTPAAPNQLWVSDITYIRVGEGFIYLYLITDAYSHKVVGWNLARDLGAANALKALEGALRGLPKATTTSLIHHSDRGVQYCCDEYVAKLNKRGVAISMTENGDPLENAVAERVNGILKTEWIYHQQFESFAQARSFVARIIDLYNTERPHQSISYMTPEVVHSGKNVDENGEIIAPKRQWKNYYHKSPEFEIPEEFTNFEGATAPCGAQLG